MPLQQKHPEELRERSQDGVLEIRVRHAKGRGELAGWLASWRSPEAPRIWIRPTEIDGGYARARPRRSHGGWLSRIGKTENCAARMRS